MLVCKSFVMSLAQLSETETAGSCAIRRDGCDGESDVKSVMEAMATRRMTMSRMESRMAGM